MREQRKGKDHANDCQIVDAEIRIIPTDTKCGLSERLRFGKGGAVGEFGPRTALGEAVLEGFGNVGDENAEGGGGDGWLRIGGMGGGDGEDGRSRRGHGGWRWVRSRELAVGEMERGVINLYDE
ncbi:hypothetical protein SLA2020_385120 [Shorea laevis]